MSTEQSLEDRARDKFRERLDRARKLACGWTSRWAKIACPGNDGEEHDGVCDSLTYTIDDVLQAELAATERATEAARADTQALRADVDAASKRLCRREGETLLAAVEALSSARWRDDAERAKLATEAEAARGEVEAAKKRDEARDEYVRELQDEREQLTSMLDAVNGSHTNWVLKAEKAEAEAARLRERLAVGDRLLLNAINVLDAEGDEGVGFADWSELADKAIAEGRAFLANLAAPARPTFNHSREDSHLAPCKDCAALMDAPALREAIEDMRDHLAAAPVTPAEPCQHPEAQRERKMFGVVCGVCREVVRESTEVRAATVTPKGEPRAVHVGMDPGGDERTVHRCTGCEWFIDASGMSGEQVTNAVHEHLRKEHDPEAAPSEPQSETPPAPTDRHPLEGPRWRVGRKLGRTLYLGDTFVGLMDSQFLAEKVAATMNGERAPVPAAAPPAPAADAREPGILGRHWIEPSAAAKARPRNVVTSGPDAGSASAAPTFAERVEAIGKGLRGGTTDPNRCVCAEEEVGRYAGTPHRHYPEPPFACARCECEAYRPAIASAAPTEEPPREAVKHSGSVCEKAPVDQLPTPPPGSSPGSEAFVKCDHCPHDAHPGRICFEWVKGVGSPGEDVGISRACGCLSSIATIIDQAEAGLADHDSAVSRARAAGRAEALGEAVELAREHLRGAVKAARVSNAPDYWRAREVEASSLANAIARLSSTTETPKTTGGEKP